MLEEVFCQQERQQLKERQRAIEEAEQSRRKAVTVTFDLLGRQVERTLDIFVRRLPRNIRKVQAHVLI